MDDGNGIIKGIVEVVPVIVAAKLGRCERAARRKRDYGREEGKEERVESARARSETTFGVFVDSGVEHGLRHRQCPDKGKIATLPLLSSTTRAISLYREHMFLS